MPALPVLFLTRLLYLCCYRLRWNCLGTWSPVLLPALCLSLWLATLELDFTFTSLVFAGWILSPTVRAVLSTGSVFCWISLWDWESRPISSSKSLSSRRSTRPQASPLGLSLVALRITQLMTVRNGKGEMMQPSLTPFFTWNQSLCCPSCLTQHLFSVYMSLMMLMTLVGRPYTCRIFQSDGWCMLSNAFSKSI